MDTPAQSAAPSTFGATAFDCSPSEVRRQVTEQLAGMIEDVQDDAGRIQKALGGFLQLLSGCDPGFEVSAGSIHALLEPSIRAFDNVCFDLAVMRRSSDWRKRADDLYTG